MLKKGLLSGILLVFFAILIVISCQNDDSGSNDDGIDPNFNAANNLGAGQSANEFLSSSEFTSMRIELAYPDGFRPTQQSIDLLVPFLQERLNKPDGITLVESVIVSDETAPYSTAEIRAIEEANRTVFNSGDELGVYIFFSDGSSDGDSGTSVTLGTAYRNTSMVIYQQTFLELGNNSPTGINRAILETSTLRHEFGHLFGLVDFGTDEQEPHEDVNAAHHCNVEGCLMQASVMTSMFNTSSIDAIPDFDPLCIQDLQANGGL